MPTNFHCRLHPLSFQNKHHWIRLQPRIIISSLSSGLVRRTRRRGWPRCTRSWRSWSRTRRRRGQPSSSPVLGSRRPCRCGGVASIWEKATQLVAPLVSLTSKQELISAKLGSYRPKNQHCWHLISAEMTIFSAEIDTFSQNLSFGLNYK